MYATLKTNFAQNQPILMRDILNLSDYSRPRVNQLIRQYIDEGKLARFSDGIFFIPSKTILNTPMLDTRKVIARKYIENGDDVFGIYSGISILNSFGLTMQVPNVYEIVTNNEATRAREIVLGGQKIILKKSRFEITKDNSKIYVLLDLLNQFGANEKIDNKEIINFITLNNIKYQDIMKYINYFPAKVAKNFNRSEVIYATL